jgi:protein-S-isoprenylcysteine O-methyltransferase Ste14
MNKNVLRQILGYLAGGVLVLVALPAAFYGLSRAFDPVLGFGLIPGGAARIAVVAVLAAVGVCFAVSSLVVQNSIGEGGPLEGMNLEISPKTKHLVVVGPYRYTRNPMLFGTAALYAAFAVFLDSPAALAAVVLFMAFMLAVVARAEEKRLLKDFGREYEEYRARVSMFVPWPPRKKS